MDDFAIRKLLAISYDEALSSVPAALKAEGFGVLTEIDIQRTLKEKLGVAFRRYTILGACNPPLAHEALQVDLHVGLMLPCNVVLYEDEQKQTVVLAIDPTKTMAATGNPKLTELARTVKGKLARALERLA